MESQQNASGARPVYTSFTSLRNTLGEFKETRVPSHIDTSVFPKKSGALISALKKAFEFLGCTEADGTTTQDLRDLVEAYGTDSWPQALGAVITDRYAPIIGDLDLVHGTSRQLDACFAQAGVTGDTKRKAIRFYLDTLTSAEIDHSPHFKPPKSKASTKRRNKEVEEGGTPELFNGVSPPPSDSTKMAPHSDSAGGSVPPSVPDGYDKIDVPVPGRPHPFSVILPLNTTPIEWEFVRMFVDRWHELNEKKKASADQEKAEPEQHDHSGSA